MRSKVAARILEKTPEETKIFARLYADIVVRISQLLTDKGFSQKDLAKQLDKSPSEISKWLNDEHNLTLRTIAKIQAELGEPIIYIPKKQQFHSFEGHHFQLSVLNNQPKEDAYNFSKVPSFSIIKPDKPEIANVG